MIASAATAAWLGLKIFLKQKEFELVKQRYLEGSLDDITAHVEETLGVYNHNWARCLNILKAFRDQGNSFDVAESQLGFLALDSSAFHITPHHRLRVLTGSEVFWNVYQHALAFATNANAIVTKEIPDTIRLKLTTDEISATTESIVENALSHLHKLHEESFEYGILTQELLNIADTLQAEPMKLKNIYKFRKKPEVISAIERLERSFSNKLSNQTLHNTPLEPIR